MKQLLASFLLMLAACGGGGTKSSTVAERPATTGNEEPTVDPTIPSWLPESCIAYHKAVVQAIDCKAVEQAKRDAIKKAFDAASMSWKAEENGDTARVDQIGATCTSATESVRADLDGKCV